MNATTIEEEQEVTATLHAQREEMLALARRLDAFGRQAEKFLCAQLDQLEQASREFEAEKAAWRRQFRRESNELVKARQEIQQLTSHNSSATLGALAAAWGSSPIHRNSTEADARRSGTSPLRFLIQPGDATSTHVGLLMFEISRLNRDLGGRGLRFEVDDIRLPKKKFLARMTRCDHDGEILELTAFPVLPLSGRGTHVALEVDLTDRIEDWITFKSHLVQSTLVNTELAQIFTNGKSVKRPGPSANIVTEAARCAESKESWRAFETAHPRAAYWTHNSVDAGQQQIARLENCYERLNAETRLRIHVELHAEPCEI
ncbi:MAG: hypothetical protein R3C17_04235 [Planctomycetaceae bacterium]